jgi:hypothetical protein
MSRTSSLGSEDGEQVVLAQWLNLRGVLWTHCPNGGRRQIAQAGEGRASIAGAKVSPGGASGVWLDLLRGARSYGCN